MLLCVNLYLQSGGVQQRIRDSAQRALGGEVNIRSSMYLPWSGFVIRGITVPDPTNANINFAEAEALRIRFALRPLMKGRFVITECTVFQPKLVVRQLENGEWVIPLGRERVEVRRGAQGNADNVRERRLFQRPSCKTCDFVAEASSFSMQKTARSSPLIRPDISANIAPDRSATGTFEIGRSDFFGSLKPRKIGGPFTWDGNNLNFPDIQGSLAGGKLTGKYHMQTREQPSFTLALQLSAVLLRKLAEDAQVEPGKTEGISPRLARHER